MGVLMYRYISLAKAFIDKGPGICNFSLLSAERPHVSGKELKLSHESGPWDRLSIKIPFYQYTDFHFKGMMVSRQSHIYNGNLHRRKDGPYTKTGPMRLMLFSGVAHRKWWNWKRIHNTPSFTILYFGHLRNNLLTKIYTFIYWIWILISISTRTYIVLNDGFKS